MKVTELFSLGANEIKNRLPMATAAKFSTQKIEGKSGKSLLAASYHDITAVSFR